MATKTETLELFRQYLFENSNNQIPGQSVERLTRIRAAFTHWCEFPMKTEKEIVDFIISQGISKSMAYYDLELIKVLLGNVKNASKEWHRYRLIVMAEESYKTAKDKKDAKAMAMVMDKYGKYTQLHIPDHQAIPYDEIVNQPFEPTEDPSPLGLKPDPDIETKIRKMKEKYADEIDKNIEDVEFTEILGHDQTDD